MCIAQASILKKWCFMLSSLKYFLSTNLLQNLNPDLIILFKTEIQILSLLKACA